ncbi:TonB-dependent receptor [Phaeodactylibacter luteus]|uniref:TonB-dependent receptor n=1 Tax=Phaeodactylibacter luteus TaxID=1564516 RepID=A0A5C6S6W9_9BACT|nr:TonB-dependent receptor [Phaeodactylibacter luteus]TXB70149.1 TonB-dependent receptor [Phaeodactylibacter luteus]
MKRYYCLILIGMLPVLATAQASLSGQILGPDGPLPGASLLITETGQGTTTDTEGYYRLEGLPAGAFSLEATYVGYLSEKRQISLAQGDAQQLDFQLREDVLNLEGIVVSATRSAVPAHKAPVMVNRIDDRIFSQTQSLSISEGLNFSPGLRLENNCQNCGFTQLRMNGLDGPYTQILINSRPVFSALAGVYGLEMLPANMVERVEVVRGGGSALYGGNAIAGTVNIITKDPILNAFEAGTNLALINGEALDRTISANGSIVDEQLSKGLSFYAFNRSREHWDANGDGFSEITQLENTTFGLDAYFNPGEYSKVKASLFHINEFRRGGNGFDLQPHQTDVAEQLGHQILGGSLSYEFFTPDLRHKTAVYASATGVSRNSYYGGGGRILGPGDTLTSSDLLALNAYGQSTDFSLATGVQYGFEPSKSWLFTLGGEYQHNRVKDEMPGYGREIAQQTGALGLYAQSEWRPAPKWAVLLGARFDQVAIDGEYALGPETLANDRSLGVIVPRASILHFLQPGLKLRMSYAQGYRAPQAFDEDLHIETVGGAALFTRLSPDLQPERSNSFNLSLDYTLRQGTTAANFIADGFFTRLDNPFVSSNPTELPSGVAVITKRNGGGATVAGANFESSIDFNGKVGLQLGGTLQLAQYDEKETLWSPETLTDANRDSLTATDQLLRTPGAYGFLAFSWTPAKPFSLSLSGTFTGPMNVPHIIDPGTEFTIIERTPAFVEFNLKGAYHFDIRKDYCLELSGGVQNLFNSYQDDFDIGADRDAGYVYGPVRPRTLFLGAKIEFK